MVLSISLDKMTYSTLEFPFSRDPREMTDRELKRAFGVVMEQKDARIRAVSDHLYLAHGVRITALSPDTELNRLPELIGSLGSLQKLTEDQVAASLKDVAPFAKDFVRELFGDDAPDGETLAMIFDGGLLWGEAFRVRYPGAEWALAGKPKNSVHYGDPVLVGVKGARFWPEFDPNMELTGFVGRVLDGAEDNWTLTMIMSYRAFSLGLGPDPQSAGQK